MKRLIGFPNDRDKMFRITIAVMCWFTLLKTTTYHFIRMGVGETIFMMSGYFSYWTILAASIASLVSIFLENKRIIDRLSGSMLMMMFIMSCLYWPISGLEAFAGAPLHSKMLHGLVPLLHLVYFAVYVRGSSLRPIDALRWTSLPLFYTGFIIVRGHVTGVYPYLQADVGIHGYVVIFERITAVTIATITVGLICIFLKKWRRVDLAQPSLAN